MRLALVVAATLGLSTQAVAEDPSEDTGIIPSLSFEGDNIVASVLNTTDETVELYNSLVPRNPDLPPMIRVKFAYCKPQTVELCLEQAEDESFREPRRYRNYAFGFERESIVLEPGQSMRRSWPIADLDEIQSLCRGADPCLVFGKYTAHAFQIGNTRAVASTETPWVLRTP